MLKKIWKGFSWIEIAVAILIFAVIVGLTLPSFPKYRCLAKQSEAKYEIMRILAAAELFKSQNGRFPQMSELLGSQRVKLKNGNYTYEIMLQKERFSVLAAGKPGSAVESDRWVVDEKMGLTNTIDACRK